MYPAILQTNRAIYAEAAPELYTQTIFSIKSSDNVCVSDRETSHGMEKGRARVWRHHPLRGMGYRNARNLQAHTSDTMRGHVEPHVFAKFESLNCYANLDLVNKNPKSCLRFDKGHRFMVEDETKFGATLRQSDVIRNLVSLLSNWPFIDNLYMMVAVHLMLDYVSTRRYLTKEEDALLYKENSERKSATDDRAWELFLDNDMLAPLETLSNVRRFKLRPVLPFSQPQQHYMKMIQDLKEKIERNWQLSQAAKSLC